MADLTYSGADKEQLVVSLAAIVCASSGQDVTADNINAAISGSGNSVAAYWAPLFASACEKADGIDKMYPKAGGGGGGSASSSAPAASTAAPVVEKPKEEEVDALAGGMDMFGGDAGGGDY
eukprot:CAMPEP_0185571314 /NCGR_PEP_ID=MMETSP0434-20130131/3363_1 /TAXON_ID=626734 ORGANISM="Favella taraikaensis, Strain Fe Narragansett Bay" /NCGR_SAMPLE_ID=MMETSP0434 /ASSEMBLY_ACC=CAM_ASM_000379 /LENGTH=120 /DNA_ID=CAMNT_0028186673 /DNA_START=14 /DNA_END=376 /DNA_ORIENTATION=-